MQVLGQRVICFTKFAVIYANFFKLSPYEWDKESKTLKLPIAKPTIRAWKVAIYLSILHQVYLTVRLCQSTIDRHDSLGVYCCQIAYFIGFSIALIVELSFLVHTREFMHITNEVMLFCKKFDSNP